MLYLWIIHRCTNTQTCEFEVCVSEVKLTNFAQCADVAWLPLYFAKTSSLNIKSLHFSFISEIVTYEVPIGLCKSFSDFLSEGNTFDQRSIIFRPVCLRGPSVILFLLHINYLLTTLRIRRQGRNFWQILRKDQEGRNPVSIHNSLVEIWRSGWMRFSELHLFNTMSIWLIQLFLFNAV